jgi:lipid A 4'-phosphatase
VRWRTFIAVLAVAAIAVGVFLAIPDLDLTVARGMIGSDGHFLLRGSAVFDWVHTWIGLLVGVCLGFFGLAAVARLLGRPIAGLGLAHALFIFGLFAIGPGLLANTVLKDHSGRARPAQVPEFGGALYYSAPFAFDGACPRNCSFVAGDPAVGFAYIGPALLLPRRRRAAGVAGALLLGGGIGLMRMFQGGHFFSDVIFSGVVVTATALALHWLIFRDDGSPRLAILRDRQA